MDKFTEKMTDGLRRFAMAGVGAVSLTIEKSREIIDQLAARGEATAADGQAACEDLQQKMNEQLASFTAKLRADYEKASFDRLLAQCAALTPEQKALLIEQLTAGPEEPEAACSDETVPDCSDEPCCADETECARTDETDALCADSSCDPCRADASGSLIADDEPGTCADTPCCSEASAEDSAPGCASPGPAPDDAVPSSPDHTDADGE